MPTALSAQASKSPSSESEATTAAHASANRAAIAVGAVVGLCISFTFITAFLLFQAYRRRKRRKDQATQQPFAKFNSRSQGSSFDIGRHRRTPSLHEPPPVALHTSQDWQEFFQPTRYDTNPQNSKQLRISVLSAIIEAPSTARPSPITTSPGQPQQTNCDRVPEPREAVQA